ncbi:helix-turn-helix domain-containing protein [Cyanobium sp. NIES-981]|uniref:helix-turn-helix domain-containing protein n=1 Tax=Cyanobium sp. NIES-981 TaxID=1851505 RepID=UPI0007DD52CA|nr:helix-turn-helix domain-containing protein [Cyanobium sp. NIES-981]SBO41790.1 Transcriptional regulator, AraC family protein [Cyanobium sp. NIES-981]
MPDPLTVEGVESLQALLARGGLAVTVTQLARGRLGGDLLALQLGPLQLLRIRLDRAIHCAGPKPAERQLVSLDLARSPNDHATSAAAIRSHGQPLLPRALFGLSASGEIHLTTFGRCDLALLIIERREFLRRAERLGCPVLEEVLARNWLAVEPVRFSRLRRYLHQLLGALEAAPTLQQVSGFEALVSGDLIPLVLEALVHGWDGASRLARAPSRIELVKAAQHWMEAHPGQPIQLEGLCREVHTSRRSLIQGFREHLGMGPMTYLRLQRLHGIRRNLLEAEPDQTTIGALATAWGFLNPGHFARQYAELFGERPSDTLASNRK